MYMGLLFSLIAPWQVPFIHVIVFKIFSSQYGHLSDIKCELKIMCIDFIGVHVHRDTYTSSKADPEGG
jgi:hypothetical protein